MTTIAYKDGVIAFDSQTTQGNHIASLNTNKHTIRDGAHFFVSGARSDYPALFEAWDNRRQGGAKHIDSASALVVENGVLYEVGCNSEDGLWYCEHDLSEPLAIGSGTSYAFGAMDMGADAKTAVRVAANRDTGTGGRIRTWKIPG